MIKRFLYICFISVLASCCGSRGPRMKAGFVPRINLVEIVYKSLDDELLFAGPVKFSQNKSRNFIAMDFTGEFINRKCDSVVYRFTVINETKNYPFSDLYIADNDTLYFTKNISLMFEESQGKYSHHRYSFTSSFAVFQKILEAECPRIILGKQDEFVAGRRWKKDSRSISNKILLVSSGGL